MQLHEVTVVILCGGLGTRAHPHTSELPKPLLEVHGRPVLRHVMEIFAAQGCRDFVLAAGFKAELISDFAATVPSEWRVHVENGGIDTGTGRRILQCRHLLGETFFATYGDGLANIDLRSLVGFHKSHGGRATLTAVPLRSQYGTVDIDNDDASVVRFLEKPVLKDYWINGGFFAFHESVFDMWAGEDLERDVLPRLSGANELFAYRHHGFWRSLDTLKDAMELDAMAASGARLPWDPTPETPSPEDGGP